MIDVVIPRMLAALVGGVRTHRVAATTVAGAVEALAAARPVLRVHLFDERPALRRNILCFHGDDPVAWDDAGARPVGDGDEVVILQAVSGGASAA